MHLLWPPLWALHIPLLLLLLLQQLYQQQPHLFILLLLLLPATHSSAQPTWLR
jgi:hypothetical protein